MRNRNDPVYENPAAEQLDDVKDMDNDLSITDKFVKSTNEIFVKFIGSTDAQKLVKGELDADWAYYGVNAGYGQTLPGGIADYKLKIKNTEANGPISNIVVIDVLPNKGDTGVIDQSKIDMYISITSCKAFSAFTILDSMLLSTAPINSGSSNKRR